MADRNEFKSTKCGLIDHIMPLAHYYGVDHEHSTKYTNSHCLLKIHEHSECHRNARLFNTNRWRARKITVHELTRAPYVTSTSRLCSDNLNTMPPRCRCDEN